MLRSWWEDLPEADQGILMASAFLASILLGLAALGLFVLWP